MWRALAGGQNVLSVGRSVCRQNSGTNSVPKCSRKRRGFMVWACVLPPPHVGPEGRKWGFICLESAALRGKNSNLMYFLALWAIFYREGDLEHHTTPTHRNPQDLMGRACDRPPLLWGRPIQWAQCGPTACRLGMVN